MKCGMKLNNNNNNNAYNKVLLSLCAFLLCGLFHSHYSFFFVGVSSIKGWVGIMITVQPFYIAGLEDPEEAKISAFGAMGVFLVTLVLSLLGIVYSSVVGSSKSDGAEAAFSSEMEAEGYVLNTGDAIDYGTKY